MNKSLKAKSQEFVELGKSFIRQHYNVPLPEFVQHIQALQSALDEYEARIERLAKFEKVAKQGGGDGDTIEAVAFKNGKWRGVSRCLKIMTEGE